MEGFRGWLRSRGRSASTQDSYVNAVTRLLAYEDPLEPILDRENSPLYRRFLVSAYRQWALYSGDNDLYASLEGGALKLPPALRRAARKPCTRKEWFALMDAIENREIGFREPIRSVVGIIVTRGVRCGDVLRLKEKEIQDAIRTGTLGYEGKGQRRIEYSAAPLLPYLEELAEQRWGRGSRLYNLVCPRSKNPVDQASRKIRRALDKLAVEFGYEPSELFAHRFRHTYANEFLSELKGDPRAVFLLQEQMGWAKPETARSYVARAERKELDKLESQMFSGRKRR